MARSTSHRRAARRAAIFTHRRAARRAAIFITGVLVGLTAVWAGPRASAAVAGWAAAPPIRERTVRLERGLPVVAAERGGAAAVGSPAAAAAAAGGARTVDPGFRFDMIGLLCDRPPVGAERFTVSLRTSADGRSWGPWLDTDLEVRGPAVADEDGAADEPGARTGAVGGLVGADGPDARAGAAGPGAFTDPVWVGSSRFVQVRVSDPRGGHGADTLGAVRLMFLNTSGDAGVADQVVSALRRTVAVIAGVGRTPAAAAMTTAPTIVKRAQWGANESWRSGSPLYAPVQMAFVHHTVNANSYTRAQAPGIVRGIYYYHAKGLHWSDIGYNFLVDRYGAVYEGRYGGITQGVIGAQTLGFNTGSTGVATIGTFTSATPPAAMMSALKQLLAWKLDVHHVDPKGSARMVCRWTQKFKEGETVVFPVISGHRQANYTACPGDALYRLLPGVRTAVAGMGLPKIYEYALGTTHLSPNGDGVQESTRVRFRVSGPADWAVEVKDKAGTLVRRIGGSGDVVDVRWDGRDGDGAVVPDGAYAVAGRASVDGANARAATATVHVDTVVPDAGTLGVTPTAFSPNGDGYGDRCRLSFTITEGCSRRVLVVDAEGAVLRTVAGWRSVGAGTRGVAWDGMVSGSGGLVPAAEGQARLRLELKDAAGNQSSAAATVRVDRTLGFLTAKPATISPNGDGIKDATVLGFALTRRATVAVDLLRDGAVVRSFDAGTLGAGVQALAWDGLLADGSRATSGTYRYRATATSSLGAIVAARAVTVDRYRPRLSVPTSLRVTLGRRARVAFTVRDPYSPKVRVTATVRDAAGRTLATIDCGWVAVGARTVVSWKPPARRTYVLTLTAVDRGGNRQQAAVTTAIKVL